MAVLEQQFDELVHAVLSRFFGQNGEPLPAAAVGLGRRLWTLVLERGLPLPLGPDEPGAPGGMSDAEVSPLVRRIVGEAPHPLLEDATRQLVKTCFYPEFKVCRDSFRAVLPDGSCRRQELSRVRRRISGTHCVDCPHWVALSPESHQCYLGGEWRTGVADLNEHRSVYLPEDFRALRRWLHAAARRGV